MMVASLLRYNSQGGIIRRRKNYYHSEASKELIRQANTGARSKQAKSVILTNIKTKEETLGFPSLKSAGEFLGVSADTVRRYILGNKSCKGYNLA